MKRLIKDARTWQLVIIWRIRKLLLQREKKLTRHIPDKNDWLRPMIEYILLNYDCSKGLTGVEIGVDTGGNAYSIMNNLPMKKLYLVDPYRYFVYPTYPASYRHEFKKAKAKATELLLPYKDRASFIFEKSEDAAEHITDNLDFVYIDGNHEYKYVKKDLELYYPKVKTGGIFGGDNFESEFPDVCRAVLEFTDKHSLKIHGARTRLSFEWWVIKKEIANKGDERISE